MNIVLVCEAVGLSVSYSLLSATLYEHCLIETGLVKQLVCLLIITVSNTMNTVSLKQVGEQLVCLLVTHYFSVK